MHFSAQEDHVWTKRNAGNKVPGLGGAGVAPTTEETSSPKQFRCFRSVTKSLKHGQVPLTQNPTDLQLEFTKLEERRGSSRVKKDLV